MTVLEAIARQEGFYVPGSRPARNHNPGDLEYGPFAKAHGATASDGRFAVFPDDATGFAALRALLLQHYQGLTIAQALNKYAPPVENATNLYIVRVCQWTGLEPTDVLDQHV